MISATSRSSCLWVLLSACGIAACGGSGGAAGASGAGGGAASSATTSSGTTNATTGASTTTGSAATTSASSGTGGGGSQGAELAMVQTQVFSGCLGSGPMSCHGSVPFGGSLNLNPSHTYSSLVGAPALMVGGGVRVVPGDVANSFIWRKLTNDLPKDGTMGNPMPTGEAIQWTELPAEKMNLLKAWIENGAKP